MFGGGGISNKTSRLYRALIDKELAVSVKVGCRQPLIPSCTKSCLPAKRQTVEKSLEVIDSEIDRVFSERFQKQKLPEP